MLRINEIIEIKRPIEVSGDKIPKGIYKIINCDKYFSFAYELRIINTNTNTNNEYRLLISSGTNIELKNIYVYIPIENDDEILIKFIKKLSINYNSVDIIEKLWKDRNKTGDYLFFGNKAHSNILILNSNLIKEKLDFPSNKNNKSKLILNNNRFKEDFNDASYLLLYLLYFNNLINYDKIINEEILEKSFILGDYILLDEKLINYIKKFLIDFFKYNNKNLFIVEKNNLYNI